jgi:hypothetical protein
MIAEAWIAIVSMKILLKHLRTGFFLLGRPEFADVAALREAMILYTYRFADGDCPRACRALCFLGGDPTVEGDFGAFGRWGMN